MEVKTKFDIDDIVFLISNNKVSSQKVTGFAIDVEDGKVEISYSLNFSDSKIEPNPEAVSESGYTNVGKGGSKSADLGNKLDYIFGKGTGNKHNIQRSQSMQIELEKIGIYDDLSGRDYLTQHLNKVLNDSSNISSVEVRSYVAKEIAGNPTIE
jgi:hypothetical protein